MLSSSRSKARREGLKEASYILGNRSDVFTIHYSCESFNKSKSSTPRVTSISIYNIVTREQKSFNIHIEAELKKYNCKKLSNEKLDAAERSLLNKFYKFVKAHQGCLWVHWNMKNSKYGFDALSLRYKILTGKNAPNIKIRERYDLSEILTKLYGQDFEINNCSNSSKLLNLAQRNNISVRGLLSGAQEAEAFSAKDYQAIMVSSQGKAEAIALVMKAIEEKNLKVNASLKEIYGINLLGFALLLGDNFSKLHKLTKAINGLIILWKLAKTYFV